MPIESKLKSLRNYAVIYGAGGIGALTALKFDLFSFPPNVQIYLSYFFSIVTIMCIFFSGTSFMGILKKINAVAKTLNEIEDEEIKKPPETLN